MVWQLLIDVASGMVSESFTVSSLSWSNTTQNLGENPVCKRGCSPGCRRKGWSEPWNESCHYLLVKKKYLCLLVMENGRCHCTRSLSLPPALGDDELTGARATVSEPAQTASESEESENSGTAGESSPTGSGIGFAPIELVLLIGYWLQ